MTRKFTDKTLLVATHNKGKLEEIAHLLEPFGVEVVSPKAFDLPEPEETETTFVGNARIKAHAAAKATGLPALADDSGLMVDALNGDPGVYSADWAETETGRDFEMAMKKVHDALMKSGASMPSSAKFCATLVLAWPDGHDEVFEGIMPGAITWPPRGENGFGYDPIFQADGFKVSNAELDRWEKNKISHRGDAMTKFVAACFD